MLITGASGYVGLELVKQLLRTTNVDILAVSSNIKKVYDVIGCEATARLQHIERDEDFISRIPWDQIGIIINLAFARKEIPQSELVRTLEFHKKLFLAVKDAKVPAIMNISSQSVYGSTPGLHSEDSELCPLGSYALAKCASEILLNTVFPYNSKTAVTNVRLDSIAGNKNLLPTFVRNGIENKRINLIGGQQIFSLLDVRDAASGIMALCRLDISKWQRVYNLGWNNKIYSLIEIADLTRTILEKYGYYGIEISLQKNDTRTYAGMDSTRFSNDTGWTPRYNMEDIIDHTIQEYLNKKQ